MENNLKNFLTNALRVIPGYDFLSEMFIFMQSQWEDSPIIP